MIARLALRARAVAAAGLAVFQHSIAIRPLPAQDSVYTLPQLVDRARDYLPLLKQRQALVQSAAAGVTDARHSLIPSLRIGDQVNLGTDNSIAGSYLPMTPTISTSAGVRGSNLSDAATGHLATLYGEYELLNFGLQHARVENAQAYLSLSRADLHRELYNAQLAVARTYYLLSKALSRERADRQNIERYREVLTIIRALARSGTRPGADSAQATAELSRASVIYNQTVGLAAQLKQSLAYLTGIPAGQLRIDTVTAAGIPAARGTIGSQPGNIQYNPLIEPLFNRREVFRTTERVIAKSYLPKVVLAGAVWARGSSIVYNDQFGPLSNGLGLQRFNYMGGIGVVYDFSQIIHRSDRLAVNRSLIDAADFEFQQGTLALTTASAQADNAILTAEANLVELPIQLQAAETVYQQKVAQYRAGVSNLIDLTNAAFVVYRSQTDYTEAVADWYLAQLDKAAAIGTLDSVVHSLK